jgi:hypothetical protein
MGSQWRDRVGFGPAERPLISLILQHRNELRHGVTGCGARHRKSLTGGAAYGMPLNDRTLPDTAPAVIPASILTILSSDWAASVAVQAITVDASVTIALHVCGS